MKVRALANLSGPGGRRESGEEFVVDAALGQSLLDRKVVEPVAAEPVKVAKDKSAVVNVAKE
jgi:hypothetical protein